MPYTYYFYSEFDLPDVDVDETVDSSMSTDDDIPTEDEDIIVVEEDG